MRPTDQPCPPPDRSPRAPKVAFPQYACDTHAHVCGPAASFPYADERVYTPPDSTFEQYLHLLAVLGVGRAVLVQPSVYGTDNRAMLEALRRAPQGLRGVAVVDPGIESEDIRRLDQVGVRGVRLNLVDRHSEKNLVPLEAVRTLARTIAPFGWHIEFLVNLDESPHFAQSVADLPVDVVVGHLGYPKGGAGAWLQSPGFEPFLRLLDGGRFWVKLTGPYRISTAPDLPYDDVTPLARRLADANPERLLWGSDWPHAINKKPMHNDGDLADLVATWLPDAGLRQQVLVANPAKLYRFADGEELAPRG